MWRCRPAQSLNEPATATSPDGMRWLLTVAIALAAGFAGSALWDLSGLGDRSTRAYLLANPEVLPEAMDVLQQRELLARIEPLRGELERPFPGAVLGNPAGSVTLVEFTDYACTYCRASVADVDALIAANPDLKVVIREYPILTAESVDAARMALAAAAKEAGIDLALAKTAIDSGMFDSQLQANHALANQLGISGTPGWVIGDRAFNGAVGREKMGEAIEAARRS